MVEAHEIYVLVQNTLEETLDVLHLQWHTVLTFKVSRDTSDAAALVLARLKATTAIRITLAATTDCRATLDDLRPAILALASPDILVIILIDEQLGAADTDTPENAKHLR